ncbi:DNA/RNA polymerases superfamily protein [Gossypium australe]|uniref:DNA/RNA polymerases superfamily protein n=1 Tax=Gossypium australe TaxID=47621 RepID=A0A5B6VZC9_9ROSI|nr:DNA/RNA polymerases superfamily protein [Gossypium australe]
MAPYKALYGRKCQTPLCWTELGERKILGPEMDSLKVASNRQESYADLKIKDTEYDVRGRVFLKVYPWQKVLRFGRKCKLSFRFIGPYKVLKRDGPIAYQLELPPELDRIHDVRLDLSFEKELVQILNRELKVLRRKRLPLVKILLQNHDTKEAT